MQPNSRLASPLPFHLILGDGGELLQNLKTLDPSKLTPLTPEVISRQATINIGQAVRPLPAVYCRVCCSCAYGHKFNQSPVAELTVLR